MDEQPIQFHRAVHKGRGTALRPQARYDRLARESVDDGWQHAPSSDGGGNRSDGDDSPPRFPSER